MTTQSRRIFVGNLPHEVTRDEIVKKFQKYGNVESVEIKTKTDSSSGQVLATFCYVNLDTDNSTLENCILLLNGIKWGERHIKVEVAKESFLQRLQRERQSAPKPTPPQQILSAPPPVDTGTRTSKLQKEKETQKKMIKRVKDSSSSDSSDSENEDNKYHPTSKLRKFFGIASHMPSESISNQEDKKNNALKVSERDSKVKQEKTVFEQTPASSIARINTSSSILKKFETFSDVWKDADEPSTLESAKPKFNSTKTHSHEAFSVQRSTENQWHERTKISPMTGRNTTLQESRFPGTNVAEEKRLKSLEEKRQAFEQQRKAVQLALSDKNSSHQNTKIVFNDDDGNDNDGVESVAVQKESTRELRKDFTDAPKGKKRKAITLFDESEDETTEDNWTGNFNLKKQFEGQKGKKLLELQNKYNSDQRFKLDERFYESDDDTNKETSNSNQDPEQSEEGIEGLAEEREQQLQILSSILGKPIPVSQPPTQQASKTQGMLRFDPLKPNHLKYELSKEVKESKKKKKTKASDIERKEEEEEEAAEEVARAKVRREEKEPEPVSQTKFYSVSETLAESLKLAKEGQGSGFSLLQMFGPSNTSAEKNQQHNNVTVKNDVLKRPPTLDCSSDDEASEAEGPTAVVNNATSLAAGSSSNKIKSIGGVWQESFFFQPNDSRLKEGAEFFSQAADPVDSAKFAKTREALRHIVRQKMRKNSQKANSFKTKVGTLRRKASLWPKSNHNVQKHRRKQRK